MKFKMERARPKHSGGNAVQNVSASRRGQGQGFLSALSPAALQCLDGAWYRGTSPKTHVGKNEEENGMADGKLGMFG